ncbi:MAG: hypothetical protein DCC75_10280, partial [Proteobacteria bacterium]
WIERELKRLGIVNYPEKLPELVSELGQQDPDEIIKLLEQLALYADSPEVSSADIKQLFSHDEVKSEFEFIDCLMNRNAARAEILIENLFQHGKSPFMLLALLAKNFATFIAIKALSDQGRTPHEIRQRLGLAPWLFGKHQSAVRTFSQAQLRRGLHAIMRADSKLKNRSVGQEAIFSELVYAIGRS